MQKFWIVYCRNASLMNHVMYSKKLDAQRIAIELADDRPKEEFFIMESVMVYKPKDLTIAGIDIT